MFALDRFTNCTFLYGEIRESFIILLGLRILGMPFYLFDLMAINMEETNKVKKHVVKMTWLFN